MSEKKDEMLVDVPNDKQSESVTTSNGTEKEEIKETPEEKKVREQQESFDQLLAEFRGDITLLRKGVSQNDDRMIGRAMRQMLSNRKKLTENILFFVIQQNFTQDSDRKQLLLDLFSQKQGQDFPIQPSSSATSNNGTKATTTSTGGTNGSQESFSVSSKVVTATQKVNGLTNKKFPEVDAFLQILLIIFQLDQQKIQNAVHLSSELVDYIVKVNRNTMNVLAAKAYFYYSRSYELFHRFSSIRGNLLSLFKTASLRNDIHGQAMVTNLLLRNYVKDHLYEQANKFLTKSPQVEFGSNSQLARYFYYKGRILAILLDYSNAHDCLQQALLKSPSSTAFGFRTTVLKLLILIKLLIGEIPEKSMFKITTLNSNTTGTGIGGTTTGTNTGTGTVGSSSSSGTGSSSGGSDSNKKTLATISHYQKQLTAYLALTREVRVGDLLKFRKVVDQYQNQFKQDDNITLVQRIRQNVIRTGLKKITMAYSKISFRDICEKLNLIDVNHEEDQDVEHIVAKAIRDGIINAKISSEGRYVESKESLNIYTTSEPTAAFEARIEFCIKLRNQAVKSMRFPQNKKTKTEKEQEEGTMLEPEDIPDELFDDEEEFDDFGGGL